MSVNIKVSSPFHQIKNLPALPDFIINEALSAEPAYQYWQKPFVLTKVSDLFQHTLIGKILVEKFGNIAARYYKTPAHSYYDWHVDGSKIGNRKCALNWIVKTNSESRTFYRKHHHNLLFWDLIEACYGLDCPTLLDVQQQHCVFNNGDDERIILSISIYNDHSYLDVLEFLTSLDTMPFWSIINND